jgi:phosphatidylethanolamine-binding protein (PEBP) family uncharacterized protein
MVRALEGNAPFEEGTTNMNTHAYFGPCPPPTGQPHHYLFTLYALKVDHVQEKGLICQEPVPCKGTGLRNG